MIRNKKEASMERRQLTIRDNYRVLFSNSLVSNSFGEIDGEKRRIAKVIITAIWCFKKNLHVSDQCMFDI